MCPGQKNAEDGHQRGGIEEDEHDGQRFSIDSDSGNLT